MVVLSKPAVIEHLSLVNNTLFHGVPLIDLSKPNVNSLLVKACPEFGFFKVINHSVPTESITKLESLAIQFFSSPLPEKEKAGPPDPFGYGNKKIGSNGYVGWFEYIFLTTNTDFNNQKFASISGESQETFQ
ncbi:Gibberellin 2-beta-dioxygenase 1 [Olea europaea subsp. europaea]|uniref:Gibberellin 2-beta-dioxygenase 1 n=1 Tax=Olea europaea subsp. europaea TaxID=158383 RepID=A0A8S0RUN1_OLEEU|nr:Gibberellin 2-beta-dioxygenase 1 [Olea europaea subsp. europaea]